MCNTVRDHGMEDKIQDENYRKRTNLITKLELES